MSDLNRKATLREVSIKASPVNDDDAIDALFGEVMQEEKAIAKVTNLLLDDVDAFAVDAFADDAFADDWGATSFQTNNIETTQSTDEAAFIAALITDDNRLNQPLQEELQKELEALRAQHQFECEYVDQLEQEIISVTNDRDRQVKELSAQLEQLQSQSQNQGGEQQLIPSVSDDRDLSDRLAIHVLQIEEEFKHRLAIAIELESQKINNQYLQELAKKDELIYQLQTHNTALEISQQTLTEELENTHLLLQESTKTIEIAQIKLSEITSHRDRIEEELIQHLSNQAQLHQSLRGLENEYVSDLTRVQDSEQQIEELQEQILRQAAKAAEYEAAIQHWKEQSVRHQHHALQLSGALDRLLDEKPVKHAQPMPVQPRPNDIPSGSGDLPMRSLRPNSKVDLPAFLVRNR